MIVSWVLSITARQSRKVYNSSTENTALDSRRGCWQKVDVLGCTIFTHMAFQRGSSSQNSGKCLFVSLTCWVLRLNTMWKKVYKSHINKIRVSFYAISCFISHPWRLLNVPNFNRSIYCTPTSQVTILNVFGVTSITRGFRLKILSSAKKWDLWRNGKWDTDDKVNFI